MCPSAGRVGARHRPRPEPRDDGQLLADVVLEIGPPGRHLLRDLHGRVQVPDAPERLVPHPPAVVSHVLGQPLRALPPSWERRRLAGIFKTTMSRRTRPWPILGTRHQARLHRVLVDVLNRRRQVLLVPDEPIEVFAMPELSLKAEYLVRPLRCERLPGMHDARQGPSLEAFHQDMDVVRHHHPREQVITIAVEVQQGVLNQLRDSFIPQMAGTCSGIKVLFLLLAQLRPMLQFRVPSCDDIGGHRIGKAESDHLDAVRVVEVRQIAA